MNTDTYMKKEISPTSLKMPKELKEKIQKNAELNRRSLSQEIIYIIEKYYEIKES